MMQHETGLVALLAAATLLPFLIASGTCYIKFSIVFLMTRNALGLQQVPSNMTLNGVALLLALFVMMPVANQIADALQQNPIHFDDPDSIRDFIDNGLGSYRAYLQRYADPASVHFFQQAAAARDAAAGAAPDRADLLALLPAYALSEIKSAFMIGFYLYLPFVVVDLLVSSVLLALGMMMMSPVTIAMPIKLLLFVAMDGWTLLSQGLIQPYLSQSG